MSLDPFLHHCDLDQHVFQGWRMTGSNFVTAVFVLDSRQRRSVTRVVVAKNLALIGVLISAS